MDIGNLGKIASSIADTGTRDDVDMAVLRRAQQIEKSTATQLIDAVSSVPSANLPSHLGSNVNTTA